MIFNIDNRSDRLKSFGKGMFGEMFMGSINRNVFLNYTDSEAQSEMLEKEMRMTVRVKTCMRGSVHALHGFLTELKLKVYLGQHENIVSLIGAYTHELGRGKKIVQLYLIEHYYYSL